MTLVATGATVALRDLGKSFSNNQWLFRNLWDEISAGEIRAIVGRSGTGKTSLLRLIAGLDFPTEGEVRVDGQKVTQPPKMMGLVVQDYSRSLFPWLKVAKNLNLALHHSGKPRESWKHQISHYLQQVGLPGVHNKYPWELSGGMQQRVALARALIGEPRLVLLDEPFASVDAITRLDLHVLTRNLIKDLGATALLVTHDIDEAIFMADSVSVLHTDSPRLSEPIPIALGDRRSYPDTRQVSDFAHYSAEIYRRLGDSGSDSYGVSFR